MHCKSGQIMLNRQIFIRTQIYNTPVESDRRIVLYSARYTRQSLPSVDFARAVKESSKVTADRYRGQQPQTSTPKS